MATLQKHGRELARFDYTTYRIALMSDGKILRNQGNGWKLWRNVKPGIDPVQHAHKMQQNRAKLDNACPNWARYRSLLVQLAGTLEARWKLHTTIEMMPDDPDGVWSTFDDYASHTYAIEECVELCSAYKLGQPELEAYTETLRNQKAQSVD